MTQKKYSLLIVATTVDYCFQNYVSIKPPNKAGIHFKKGPTFPFKCRGWRGPAWFASADVTRCLAHHLHLFITLKLKPGNNIQPPLGQTLNAHGFARPRTESSCGFNFQYKEYIARFMADITFCRKQLSGFPPTPHHFFLFCYNKILFYPVVRCLHWQVLCEMNDLRCLRFQCCLE